MGGHIDRKTIGIEGVSEWKERNLKRRSEERRVGKEC